MRRARSRSSAIDVTPLIDVLFMLIIFFVLTTAFVRGAIDVELPRGDASPIDGRPPVVVTVGKDSSLTWEGKPITIVEAAARARAQSADVLVAGDSDAPYGAVAQVLDALREAGLSHASLAFEAAR